MHCCEKFFLVHVRLHTPLFARRDTGDLYLVQLEQNIYLNNTESVVNGAFHFVAVEIVGSTEDDRAGCARLGALDHDQLVVADTLLAHLHTKRKLYK